MAVVAAFVMWCAFIVVAGCSETRSKGETWIEHVEATAVHDEATFVQLDQAIAQLDQEIQLKPPPAYEGMSEERDSSAYSCEATLCFIVLVPGSTSARELASITEEVVYPPKGMSSDDVQNVDFDDTAASYCFQSKDVAVSALGSALKHAVLLGKTDKCYLAVYRGSGPALRP
jgi:hypothetical protein